MRFFFFDSWYFHEDYQSSAENCLCYNGNFDVIGWLYSDNKITVKAPWFALTKKKKKFTHYKMKWLLVKIFNKLIAVSIVKLFLVRFKMNFCIFINYIAIIPSRLTEIFSKILSPFWVWIMIKGQKKERSYNLPI